MIPGINQPKKNTTMVEPFVLSSSMAIANQLTPPPGAYVEGADRGQCCRFLYYCADRPRKKINWWTQQFYFSFYKLSKSNIPKAMEATSLHAPPRSHRLFNNSSVFTSYFWLVVVCRFANWYSNVTFSFVLQIVNANFY